MEIKKAEIFDSFKLLGFAPLVMVMKIFREHVNFTSAPKCMLINL